MTRITAVWTLSLLLVASNALAEGWLCITDFSSGFAFDQGRWGNAVFDVENKTYLIRRPLEDELAAELNSAQWVVTVVGSRGIDDTYCPDEVNEHGLMFCSSGIHWRFTFNSDNLRFIAISSWGYWSVGMFQSDRLVSIGDEGGETPYIEIGRCSPL